MLRAVIANRASMAASIASRQLAPLCVHTLSAVRMAMVARSISTTPALTRAAISPAALTAMTKIQQRQLLVRNCSTGSGPSSPTPAPATAKSTPTATTLRPTTLRGESSSSAASSGSASGSAAAGGAGAANGATMTHVRTSTPLPRNLTSPLPELPPLAQLPSKLFSLLRTIITGTARGTLAVGKWTVNAIRVCITDPARASANLKATWADIKHECHHYWVGSKLFVAELKTAGTLVRRVGKGESLSRRERLQLKRAMNDLLRMVPFIVIVIIPFAEFSLPVLLKLFPNMLPSQFEKADVRQEAYKRSLNVKLELHGILQEVVQDRIQARLANASSATSAAGGAGASGSGASEASTLSQLMGTLDDVRTGKALPADLVVRVAKMFSDDITLDNLPRGQLAALAKYIGLSPFAPERILRYQLRSTFKGIKEDDAELVREGGTATLTRGELEAACESRGMRAIGLSDWQLRRQLDDWLELSIDKAVPMTLLVLSRAFQIATVPGQLEPTAEQALQESISSIDTQVIKEVVLAQSEQLSSSSSSSSSAAASTTAAAAAAAAAERADRVGLLNMKIESIAYQNALIEAEREAAATSEQYSAAEEEARAKAALAAAALGDPLTSSTPETKQLVAEAASAAQAAADKRAIADAKREVVLRLRASDAGRAAAEASPSSAPSTATTPSAPDAEDEADALRQLAATATVAREKELLDRIKRARKQIESAEMLARGRISVTPTPTPAAAATATAGPTAAPAAADGKVAAAAAAGGAGEVPAASKEDAGTAYLQSRLDAMLADIETQFAAVKANTDLRKALQNVDANKDNQVTREEIDQALRTIIGSAQTEAAAAALIRYLDSDKDGVVSVDQLQRFLDEYADRVAKEESAKEAIPMSEGSGTAGGATKHADEPEGEEKKGASAGAGAQASR